VIAPPGEMSRLMHKKILFIGHDASRTGAPLLLLQFLKWLRRNSKIDFEILLRGSGELIDEYRAVARTHLLHPEILPFPTSRISQLRATLGFPSKLHDALRRSFPKRDFPVVYSNTITNGSLISYFGAASHRIICHVHEMRVLVESVGGADARRSVGEVDLFVAASSAVKDDLKAVLAVPEHKIEVVHAFSWPAEPGTGSGANSREETRAELGINASDVVIGMCGITNWGKGADLFPLLARNVRRCASGVAFRFMWVGAQPGSIELLHLLRDTDHLQLNDVISYVPAGPYSRRYLAAMDVFALTSREDSFPLVMLEAASLGIPVLCFEHSGGGPEFVGQDAGVVVPYMDLDSFAEAAIHLGRDVDARRRYGERARAKALGEFSIDRQAPKLAALLEAQLAAE
jgi:glycosyltransferase involved in cell wall biosynthesis